MKFSRLLLRLTPLAWLLAVAVLGCAHLPNYALPGPGFTSTPTPTPGPTSTPSSCATQAPNATVIIVISSSITAAVAPIYGTINGYTTLNSDGTFGNVATVISAKPTDVVQFVNGETTGPNTIFHSAVSFPNATSFPPAPYTFPASAAQPIGNAVSSLQWSTGRLSPLPCFSQPFVVSSGTYYYGDLDYYNLTNMRDVIVVSSSAKK